MKICKTTFIFVNLDFVERLLEKKNENFCGTEFPLFNLKLLKYRYNSYILIYKLDMSERRVVTAIESRTSLMEMLKQNPGHIVLKLGAEWCGPCKNIESNVKEFFINCPPNVICGDIDVDESFDMYAYLKSKRMVDGIPAVLVYSKGNTSFIPDESYSGGDPVKFNTFAETMLKKFNDN